MYMYYRVCHPSFYDLCFFLFYGYIYNYLNHYAPYKQYIIIFAYFRENFSTQSLLSGITSRYGCIIATYIFVNIISTPVTFFITIISFCEITIFYAFYYELLYIHPVSYYDSLIDTFVKNLIPILKISHAFTCTANIL